MSSEEISSDSDSRKEANSYLVFRLGSEVFGTNLFKVLEVMKLPEVKEVPYMKPAYRGVMNLRGQIVGLVDLRLQFEMKVENLSQGMVLVLENGDTPIAAVVDDLISVEEIPEDFIDRQPIVETKIPAEFLYGIAKKNERLMTLIDISGCLSSMDLRSVRQKGKVA